MVLISREDSMSHQDRLVAFLKKEQGGMNLSNQQIKDFSNEVRALGLLDLSKSATQEWVMTDEIGQGVLVTLGTYFTLGLLNKFVEIKEICKDR